MAMPFCNDVTLKKSTFAKLQTFFNNHVHVSMSMVFDVTGALQCQLLQANNSKETYQLIRSNTLITYRNTKNNIEEFG